VEAKGVTRFGNTQLASKTRRLRHIFGADGKNYPGVEPWFVLASPERPKVHSDAYRQGLRLDEIPDWMLFKGDFAHIELLVSDDRLLVERCDKDGRPDRDGKFWQPKRGPLLSSVRVGREGA
jgi:hypothetical protein